MEADRNRLSRQNTDILGQKRIECERHFAERHLQLDLRYLDVRNHAESVDAGVSAARTANPLAEGKSLTMASSIFCCTPVPVFWTCHPA
jgi:hypothetical protein